ncbi:peptide-methionine (S)-S-oxide reductase [Lacinutrix jangbogonensis]|uniref:peptide-methionine (S)-S-oxide reductase n=1 Tax=Lacinutrix jangbogonensis TaxID=1469557 RepID=UPI00053DF911|nr:peptide-methionine (S)-S-oxide reductase [Lacinutrix jangbogonensis]
MAGKTKIKSKIGFGGGCHWCTEAVFQSLKGVEKVDQGFVASVDKYSDFSEAVIVHFDSETIALKTLLEVHLRTHKSTSNHSMREKYRSAVYTFSEEQRLNCEDLLLDFQNVFKNKLITNVLPFSEFKPSSDAFQNYYQKDPKKPFCETFINPKLKQLLEEFFEYADLSKLSHLNSTQV